MSIVMFYLSEPVIAAERNVTFLHIQCSKIHLLPQTIQEKGVQIKIRLILDWKSRTYCSRFSLLNSKRTVALVQHQTNILESHLLLRIVCTVEVIEVTDLLHDIRQDNMRTNIRYARQMLHFNDQLHDEEWTETSYTKKNQATNLSVWGKWRNLTPIAMVQYIIFTYTKNTAFELYTKNILCLSRKYLTFWFVQKRIPAQKRNGHRDLTSLNTIFLSEDNNLRQQR